MVFARAGLQLHLHHHLSLGHTKKTSIRGPSSPHDHPTAPIRSTHLRAHKKDPGMLANFGQSFNGTGIVLFLRYVVVTGSFSFFYSLSVSRSCWKPSVQVKEKPGCLLLLSSFFLRIQRDRRSERTRDAARVRAGYPVGGLERPESSWVQGLCV